MDHAVWRGDEEAIEVFPQLLDFIAPRDAVHFQKRCGSLGIIRLQFQPDVRVAQVGNAVDPRRFGPN